MEESSLFHELGLRRYHRHVSTAKSKWTGYVLLLFSLSFGGAFLYASIISKALPDSGIYLIDAIKYDYYFCYLIPLAIIPTFLVIYLNWLTVSHFVQN
jgi:hypothetical protein